MHIQIDSDHTQWRHCFTGRVQGYLTTIYQVRPLAWQLFVVGAPKLVEHLHLLQVVEASIEPDGCGVMVTIQHRIERPTPGEVITLLSACQQPQEVRYGSAA